MGPGRPGTINGAFIVSVALPVLYTVLMAVNMIMAYSFMNTTLEEQTSGLSSDEMQAASAVGTGFFIVVASITMFVYVVLTGLWVLFGFKLRAGRNWARITLTILGAIWALFAAIGLFTGTAGMGMSGMPQGVEIPTGMTVLSYAMNGVTVVGVIAFIVLAFMKPSNWYIQGAQYR